MGGVVTPAQSLLAVVPANTGLEIEAMVRNQDSSRCVYMLSFRARGVQAMDLCGTINGQDVFRSYILLEHLWRRVECHPALVDG